MPHLIKIRNFKSFWDEVQISRELIQHDPKDDRLFIAPAGKNTREVMAVFGANASSKTSMIKSTVILDALNKLSI